MDSCTSPLGPFTDQATGERNNANQITAATSTTLRPSVIEQAMIQPSLLLSRTVPIAIMLTLARESKIRCRNRAAVGAACPRFLLWSVAYYFGVGFERQPFYDDSCPSKGSPLFMSLSFNLATICAENPYWWSHLLSTPISHGLRSRVD